MYCSGCGQALAAGQQVCSQCGRPVALPAPPVPNLAFELTNYANRVRALSTVWFIYGGLVLVTGMIGLSFASSFFNNGFGPWMRGPWAHGNFPFGPGFGPAILHIVWLKTVGLTVLAVGAGWGLIEHAPWGRILAIVAAFLNLLNIPFGTAIAIWTLVTLLGYRNTSLYDQL